MGGGLSGTLAAAALLRRARSPLRVTLVERSAAVGAGVAYGTSCPEHFLNVRAAGMSGVAGQPDHLLEWLRGAGRSAAARWGAEPDPDAFLPRGLYAEYARGLLDAAAAGAAGGVTLEVATAEALALRPEEGGLAAHLSDGRAIAADHVVVAVGNPAPRHPTDEHHPVYESGRYTRDPWSDAALHDLAPEAPILIVGTNLTMIDLVVSLARRGHRGTIHAVSRHGLLPREHAAPRAGAGAGSGDFSPRSVREAARALRERSEHGTWRAAVDSVRPSAQRIWMGWPEEERRRFLRHARPYWEVHRHRAVPANVRDVERLMASKQLLVHAARIRGYRDEDSSIQVALDPRGRGGTRSLRAERIWNATGPEGDYRRAGLPLVDQIFRDGLGRPGPLGLGLDATPDGALRDGSGAASGRLSALGPPLRGTLWETTAIPEIREQAARLAERLLP